MKRKLVEFDVFQRIEKEAVSSAERELALAEDVLAKALGADGMKLHCFGEGSVTYQTADGTYVHAGYTLTENALTFSGIEELVIDESTERKASKTLLSDMVDSLLRGDEQKANSLFNEYMSMPVIRRGMMSEAKKDAPPFFKKKGEKKEEDEKKGKKAPPFGKKGGEKFARVYLKGADAKKKKKLTEWARLVGNVYGYLTYKEIGPALRESHAQQDDKGNVVGLRIPTSKVRNEGKILSFNWKTMSTEVEVKRSKAKMVSEDTTFIKAVADLKRANAVSDHSTLQETLEAIAAAFPNVLYLTQDELAKQVGVALETAGVRNWDDAVCEFLADGILQVAHEAYQERAAKLMRLAGVNPSLKYEDFKSVADKFLPGLDEMQANEMRVYHDLYSALYEVYELAQAHRDDALKTETASQMRDLYLALKGEIEPDLDIVEAAAEYLALLVEGNLPGAGSWDVSNTAFVTPTGEHPSLKGKPKVGAVPGSYTGDWGDEAPVSDGKTVGAKKAEQMRSNAWGNIGGKGVYPDVDNPYVPKPFGDYTMKGEKGVDKAVRRTRLRRRQDTWPSLTEPGVPKAVTPKSLQDEVGQPRR
jgi:hypothetical protein